MAQKYGVLKTELAHKLKDLEKDKTRLTQV